MENHPDLVCKTDILSKTGTNLYLNADKADVHFTFDSVDERVPAHKIILAGGSDVFETMFYGSLKEQGDVKIVDSSVEAFKEFLRFFYFNTPISSMEHVPEIMYLSKKYNLTECHEECASLLERSVTSETVLSTLSLAIFHEHEQLQRSCETFIGANLQEMLKSAKFQLCDRQVLDRIVKMDRAVIPETEMFEACMTWVRVASEEDHLTRDIVLSQLGSLFHEIRFGDMTFQEFAKLLPVYGELFSVNEYTEILQVISGQETEPKIFVTSRRLIVDRWDDTRQIRCDRYLSDAMYCVLPMEKITMLSSNAPLLLGNFAIVPIFDSNILVIDHLSDIVVTIIVNSTEILTKFTCTLERSRAEDEYTVNLPTPISIRPETLYEIRIKFPTIERRYSCMNLKPIVNIDTGIVVNFGNDEVHDVCFTVGIIKSVGFNLLDSQKFK